MRKRHKNRERKTLLTLCQNRESSLGPKQHPCSLSKSRSLLLLQIKVVRDFPSILFEIKSTALDFKSNTSNHTSNSKTSRHDSRSNFIALQIVKFLGNRIKEILLYSFSVKSHTEDCTHIYTNQYKLIICYTIS